MTFNRGNLAFLSLCAAIVVVALASRLPAVERRSSPDSLNEFEGVTRLLDEAVENQDIAGAVALVLQDGKVVYDNAVGWRDLALQASMRRNAIFRIASMTKPITSVAIMILVEEGKLEIDDPLSKYLPEFASVQVADSVRDAPLQSAKRDLTIRDLLTHTSGISYGFLDNQSPTAGYRQAGVSDGLIETTFPLAENVARLARCPLIAQPGEAWQYGLSTDVLGRVVEVVSGQPLDEFFRDRIFLPLGMHDTSFFVPEEKSSRFVTLYHPAPNGKLEAVGPGPQRQQDLIYSATFQSHAPPPYLSGGAGLVSTASDYARFLSMMLGEGAVGNVRLLKPDTVRQMTTNQIGDLNTSFPIHGDKFGFGVGVYVNSLDRNGASPGTYSWGGVFHTFFWVDPQQQVIGIVMTQLYPFDHSTLWSDFQANVYQSLNHRAGESAEGPKPGDVYREYWAHFGGNRDWRVTDPNATAPGAKEFLPNPVLHIAIGDLKHARRAEVVLERWGGHLKTGTKQIRFNGHPWITVPEISTTPRPAAFYYSQDNPCIEIPLEHLHEGDNTLTGTCSGLDGFGWGQWGLYAACVRVYYDASAIDAPPRARIVAPRSGATLAENPTIEVDASCPFGVARVDVLAKYDGYDENGDGVFLDWHHGYFKESRDESPMLSGHVGTDLTPPFEVEWDTTWVPDQDEHPITLVARVQDRRGLWSVSDVVSDLRFRRRGSRVVLCRADNLPTEFGVRNGQRMSCAVTIPVGVPLDRTVEAVLPLRTWHGWDEHHHHLRLNDHAFPIAGKNHLYDFDLHPIPVEALRPGANEFSMSSDTEHHMLEILWPGPALLIRYEESSDADF